VARAATQKPWFRSGGRSDLYDGNRPLNGHGICLEGDKQDTIAHVFFDKRTGEGFSDANHIATFDPPTVLKLIALARLNPPAASGGGDKEGFMVSQGNLPPPSAAQDAEMWAPCTECGAEPLIMHREDCPVMLANLANLANLGSPLVRGGE
jgi:hypothetical protein